jgi:hypothetical protein
VLDDPTLLGIRCTGLLAIEAPCELKHQAPQVLRNPEYLSDGTNSLDAPQFAGIPSALEATKVAIIEHELGHLLRLNHG